jgi:crossover junction endodeoxyribonuclease RuvC
MRILGIDPGLQTTGFGVVDVAGHALSYVASGVIKTTHLEMGNLPARLKVLYDGIRELRVRYEPDEAGSEYDIIRIFGELLLPYLHPFSITILGMINAQAIAENTLKAFHNLHGEGYLGQQVKHLLMVLQRLLYQMNIDFSLSTRCNAMKQHHIMLHKLHENLIIAFLLSLIEPLHIVEIRLFSAI